MSSDRETGRLLAVLASSIQRNGRILELGTGVGFGAAALVAALQPRDDVRVVTVERDEQTAAAARDNEWPSFVEFVVGDIVELLPTLGTFGPVFADAQGGKWIALDRTIEAVKPGGFCLSTTWPSSKAAIRSCMPSSKRSPTHFYTTHS